MTTSSRLCLLTLLSQVLLAASSPAGQRPGAASPITDGVQLPASHTGLPAPVTPPRADGLTSVSSVVLAGGNRLVATQNTDGGWGWPLTGSSVTNTVGPIGMGLAQAYQHSGAVAQRTALTQAGTLLLSKTNTFSPTDGLLAAELDRVLGVTTYSTHVMTNFYNPLAAGTYNLGGLGVLYTTAAYVQKIRTDRVTQGIANMAAWDLGVGLVGAASVGAGTAAWIAGVKAETDELDGNQYYDVLGLAGVIYGLSFVHENYDPVAGEHAAAGSLSDLAAILATYQISGGGFTWNSRFLGAGNESNQETGYAILALNEANRTVHLAAMQGAANFLMGMQLGTGGWNGYVGDPAGENNELTAEALWGIVAAFPPPVHNITQDVHYPTIQGAMTPAHAGDTIIVASGTYPENVSVGIRLTLQGAGSSTGGTVISPASGIGLVINAGGSSPSGRLVVRNLRVSGASTSGIEVTASNAGYLTFEDVAGVGNGAHGVNTNPPVGSGNFLDWRMIDCNFSSNGNTGLRFASYVGINGLTIANSHFDGNVYGVQSFSGVGSPLVTNVQVTGSTFNTNSSKGMYFENLDNAVFSTITVSNSGTAGAWAAGVDINLKYHAFQNISFTNSDFTNCGTGDPVNGAGIAVKARDDGSYAGNPATLTNVQISGCTVSGCQEGLRFGEPAANNVGPTNVTVFGCSISGSILKSVRNESQSRTNASGNWHGGSAIGTNIDYTPRLNSGGDLSGDPGFQGDFSNLWVDIGSPQVGSTGRIQEGINLVTGSTVHVLGGTYAEAVNINKANVSLLGDGASVTTINPGSGSLNALTLSANGLTVSGFTLTGGQNGIYGTTANSKFMGLTVTGNAQNGIQLVNADFNYLQGNTISSHASGAGIRLTGSRQNTLSGSTLQGNQYNVMVEINGSRQARGNIIQGNTLLNPGTWSVNVTNEPRTTMVNFNVFSAPSKYVRNTSASQAVNAQYNWFGGEASPGPGLPDFDGAVDFSHNYATSPTVSIFPVSYSMPTGSTVTLNVMAMLPAGVFGRGIDATLNWTRDDLIPDQGDPLEGSFFNAFSSRLYLFYRPTSNSVRINAAILGTPGGAGNPTPGIPYVGTVFSQEFQALGEGTSTLTLTGVQLRDQNNIPIAPVVIDPPTGATLLADGSAPSVTPVLIDNTTLDNDNFVKNLDNITVTATVTDASILTAADITADLSGLYGGSGHSADNPSTYAGSVATWTVPGVTCSPANGSIAVAVTARDPVGNVGTGSDNITADNTAPTAATSFVSKTVSPGGHQKIALNWTAGTDANYRGVAIRYNAWSYPTYPTGATPVYPATSAAGTGVSATPITGTSMTHNITARNVYYYSVFAVDWAGNYGPLDPSGTDRAASYYLGDLGSGTGTYIPGSGGYNGQVNYDDLYWFSRLYFSTAPGWTALDPNAAEGDFGPTLANKTYPANNRFGIARPDGRIDFEDLIIFSLNYNNVVPKIAPPDGILPASELAVELHANTVMAQPGERFAVTIYLANDGRAIKGTSVVLRYDPARLVLDEVEPAGIFSLGQQAFIAHKEEGGMIRIDAAILGTGRCLEFSSDLAVAHFHAVQAGEAQVTLQSAVMRDAGNQDMGPALRSQPVALPAKFTLSQNYPNPFNPATLIEYTLPQESRVTLKVYNTLGQEIATLVDEVQPAGYRSVTWNGRDMASGVYFYRLQAGDFGDLKRMLLVK
jgi:hypothetical protein